MNFIAAIFLGLNVLNILIYHRAEFVDLLAGASSNNFYDTTNYMAIRYNTIDSEHFKKGFKQLTMRQWTTPSLVQIMACRLLSTKPLSEPMLTYC